MSAKTVCSPLGGTVGEKLDSFFQRKNCFIEVNPGHVIMPKKYQDISDEIVNTDVRPDDVWMISYPRTGKQKTPPNSTEWPIYLTLLNLFKQQNDTNNLPINLFILLLETFCMLNDFLYYIF